MNVSGTTARSHLAPSGQAPSWKTLKIPPIYRVDGDADALVLSLKQSAVLAETAAAVTASLAELASANLRATALTIALRAGAVVAPAADFEYNLCQDFQQ